MSTHLRFAAGVCVLSTGLMIGSAGGAIAAADPAPSTSSGSPNAANPIKTIADNLRNGLQNSLNGINGTLNSLKPGHLPSLNSKPKSTVGGSPTVHGSTGSITPPATDPAPPADDTSQLAADDTGSKKKPAASNPVVALSQVASNAATAASLAASNAAQAASLAASNAASAASLAAANATKQASLAASNVITTAAETVAGPVAQVVTSVEGMLTSVTNAGVALSQLPADLSDLLGVPAVVPGDTAGTTPGHPGAPRVIPPVTTIALPSAPIVALPELPGLPAPTVTALAPVTTPLDVSTEAGRGADAVAPLAAPSDVRAGDVLSMVEHVIGAFVASVSLTALLAVALPGLGALLGTCAAGIRVGYRQAKAGAELPDTAISRFVGSGPVGVVRSSSQIALRHRPTRTVREGQRPAQVRSLGVRRPVAASADLLDHAV